MLERAQIELILPHRYQALLLDRAEITETGAIGYLTVREDIVKGHFPGNPVMRGFDRAEMLAQLLGIAANKSLPKGHLAYLVEANGLKWSSIVVLGDLVRAEVTITRRTRRIIEGSGKSFVGDKLVAEASFLKFVVGKAQQPLP